MALLVGRILVALAGTAIGLALAASAGLSPVVGALVGAGVAALAIRLEVALGGVPLIPFLWTVGGGAAGLLLGLALGAVLAPFVGTAGPAVRSGVALLGAWVGAAVSARRAPELTGTRAPGRRPLRLLDTSVLIDGRVADVAEAGFLDGGVIVPQFVVHELQRLADSGETLRRNRGRRGFDVLERLRAASGVDLELVETDFPALAEIDAKLVALARESGARLLTNDGALARVAALAGVAVARVNELATAVRVVALPGEGMQVQVMREGKEPGQGVAYLDDGTMVVVEGGKRFIGQSLDVTVTSVLQTSAGRMIFSRPRSDEVGVRDA
jgi:rRNA-processing protein FCF1